jgi:hypothetical protein
MRDADSRCRSRRDLRDQIERGDASRDFRRMVVRRRRQHDAVAEANALCPLRARGEKHFGRRRVRVLFEEVVLDLPGVVDAQPVGELHLIERLLVQAELAPLVPRPRQLVLVENPELHAPSSLSNDLSTTAGGMNNERA